MALCVTAVMLGVAGQANVIFLVLFALNTIQIISMHKLHIVPLKFILAGWFGYSRRFPKVKWFWGPRNGPSCKE